MANHAAFPAAAVLGASPAEVADDLVALGIAAPPPQYSAHPLHCTPLPAHASTPLLPRSPAPLPPVALLPHHTPLQIQLPAIQTLPPTSPLASAAVSARRASSPALAASGSASSSASVAASAHASATPPAAVSPAPHASFPHHLQQFLATSLSSPTHPPMHVPPPPPLPQSHMPLPLFSPAAAAPMPADDAQMAMHAPGLSPPQGTDPAVVAVAVAAAAAAAYSVPSSTSPLVEVHARGGELYLQGHWFKPNDRADLYDNGAKFTVTVVSIGDTELVVQRTDGSKSRLPLTFLVDGRVQLQPKP
ncbi:hypothetical protein HK105_203322 [Polyrhizophydium stewartii]|uniref:Uncharacterized protein n=1 Tax=Polyrhizophydium stewartii TaxID=2732419 RepID=A0ABR4NCI9_9FUNG